MVPNSVVIQSAVIPLQEPERVELRARLGSRDHAPPGPRRRSRSGSRSACATRPTSRSRRSTATRWSSGSSRPRPSPADGARLAEQVLASRAGRRPRAGDGRAAHRGAEPAAAAGVCDSRQPVKPLGTRKRTRRSHGQKEGPLRGDARARRPQGRRQGCRIGLRISDGESKPKAAQRSGRGPVRGRHCDRERDGRPRPPSGRHAASKAATTRQARGRKQRRKGAKQLARPGARGAAGAGRWRRAHRHGRLGRTTTSSFTRPETAETLHTRMPTIGSARLSEGAASEPNACRACGASNVDGSRFCGDLWGRAGADGGLPRLRQPQLPGAEVLQHLRAGARNGPRSLHATRARQSQRASASR